MFNPFAVSFCQSQLLSVGWMGASGPMMPAQNCVRSTPSVAMRFHVLTLLARCIIGWRMPRTAASIGSENISDPANVKVVGRTTKIEPKKGDEQ